MDTPQSQSTTSTPPPPGTETNKPAKAPPVVDKFKIMNKIVELFKGLASDNDRCWVMNELRTAQADAHEANGGLPVNAAPGLPGA